jgi:hypothetical protein
MPDGHGQVTAKKSPFWRCLSVSAFFILKVSITATRRGDQARRLDHIDPLQLWGKPPVAPMSQLRPPGWQAVPAARRAADL